ncbi:PRC-barrel domain containing protein [Methylobacterium sp. WL122]|nr:PRC-barrel domain containing protein [Methylobacterium sp. WL122]
MGRSRLHLRNNNRENVLSYRTITAALALACLSVPALAQTTPAPGTAMPASSDMTSSGMGMKMADTATVKLKYVTVKPADVMSSKLVGTTVYNNKNETVGEVEDLVIENGKTLTGVVVSVGGFLGMGESYVVLDPSTLAISDKDGKWMVHADTDKDTLKNAPKFTYSKMKK